MPDQVMSALVSAWITTLIATTLLAGALAMAPVWPIYLRALPRALDLGP
ncbi:MAG TPA: hypothetical protein VMF05_01955 [Stellaceae bacterium]|jgi:hypothetical protein|nr:hypothetical protein [Stellaceae bacterium]